MAGILDFVRVAADGIGKRIANLRHDGLFGAEAGFQQLTGVMDPVDPTQIGRVTSALPATDAAAQVTREAPDNYDSGLGAIPTTSTAVTALAVRVTALLLVNTTTSQKLVTVTNTANTVAVKFPLQPNMTQPLALHGLPMAGIKWEADAAGVNGQIWGRT